MQYIVQGTRDRADPEGRKSRAFQSALFLYWMLLNSLRLGLRT
ncbi:hypothetical protein [Paenibacillus cellulositrophicus]|nr:hypothetical protein [Paenibacillus cellulositrophicus]